MTDTITTQLIDIKRLPNSINGNPTYQLITKTMKLRTRPDDINAYDLDNHFRTGDAPRDIEITLDNRGHAASWRFLR